MALTKHKLKKEMLEKNFEESERGNGREDDPRILPYYNLKEGEKLEVIFIPDEEGNLFRNFKKHGPNLRMPGAGSIDCIYHSSRTPCPACQHGFDLMDTDKEAGKKWMAKDYHVAQCVVIKSPFEIDPLPDGNEARIVFLPFKVMQKIKEDYKEGLVEDPTEEIFVFKKTMNAGNNASYENSFFRNGGIPDDIVKAFDDVLVEPHNIDDGKIVPEAATEDDVTAWVDKVQKMMEKSNRNKAQSGQSLKDKVGDRMDRSKSAEDGDDDQATNTGRELQRDQEADKKEEASTTSGKKTGSSLRDRLRKRETAE